MGHFGRGLGMPSRRHSADLRGRRQDLGIGVRDMAAGHRRLVRRGKVHQLKSASVGLRFRIRR
jgi:hypothetical protein